MPKTHDGPLGLVPCIKVVRCGRVADPVQIADPDSAADFWNSVVSRRSWYDGDREHAVVLLLDNHRRLKAWSLVSIGSDTQCIIDPMGVFRSAVAVSACSIVVMHNHPSAVKCKASWQDVLLTKRMISSGGILGVRVEDHVVVGADSFYSIRENHEELFANLPGVKAIAADRRSGKKPKGKRQ